MKKKKHSKGTNSAQQKEVKAVQGKEIRDNFMRSAWIDGGLTPIRDGWYERDYSEILNINFVQAIYIDKWMSRDGVGYWYVEEPKGTINDAHYENLPWRGLLLDFIRDGK